MKASTPVSPLCSIIIAYWYHFLMFEVNSDTLCV